ncbi:hypothetical protein ACUN0C_19710 [Faunimonas sp. B44]|uniref:hypothetical protein n=1 Tax=Faunimonas sp. B44 TaxID=3461493 RepID=UPI0040450B78
MPNVNVQQLVSLALIDRGLTFEAAHDFDRMNDPAVQDIRRRIELVYSPELTEARPARQASRRRAPGPLHAPGAWGKPLRCDASGHRRGCGGTG